MKFKYVGDKAEMKNVYGYDFSGGVAVEIPKENELVIAKLRSNNHFEVVKKARKMAPDKAE